RPDDLVIEGLILESLENLRPGPLHPVETAIDLASVVGNELVLVGDLGVDERRGDDLGIAGSQARPHFPHYLDVLLRHRPSSIPPRLSSIHRYTRGLALPLIEVAV